MRLLTRLADVRPARKSRLLCMRLLWVAVSCLTCFQFHAPAQLSHVK